MQSTKSPPKKSKRRKEIIHIAADLYKNKGYSATSMRDLADAVGLEAASLYNHIKSKEDLLQDICFRMAELFQVRMEEIIRSDHAPIDKLKFVLAHYIEVSIEYPKELTVMNNEWKHLGEPYHTTLYKMRMKYENQIIQILKEGMHVGQIALANPRVLMYTIMSSMQWLGYWYRTERGISPEELQKTIQDVLIMGITV